MRTSDIEKMLKNNKEFTPSEALKQKVYNASLKVVPVDQNDKTKSSLFKTMSFIMAPAIVLIFCFTLIGISLSNERYLSLYIDINPSVEIVVNRFDYIVDVNYLNEDATIEYTELALKGEKIDKAINNILDKLETEGYLENKEMIISVVSKSSSAGEQLLNDVKVKASDYIKEKGKEVTVEGKTHTKEEKVAADEHQLSPAKYKLIEYILMFDETYLLEDLKTKSVEELSELLNELSGEIIEEVLEKPFDPKEEKPFGDVDVDSLKTNRPEKSEHEIEKPEFPKHEEAKPEEDLPEGEELPEQPEEVKPEFPGHDFEKPEQEKHVCTEECPEDCELANKPEFPGHDFEKPEQEKHVCTDECPEDCELANKPEFPGHDFERPEQEKHVCTEECPEDCELANKPEFPGHDFEKPEQEKHVCTEECPEDCELANKHEFPSNEHVKPEEELPEGEKTPEQSEEVKPEFPGHDFERPEQELPEGEKTPEQSEEVKPEFPGHDFERPEEELPEGEKTPEQSEEVKPGFPGREHARPEE